MTTALAEALARLKALVRTLNVRAIYVRDIPERVRPGRVRPGRVRADRPGGSGMAAGYSVSDHTATQHGSGRRTSRPVTIWRRVAFTKAVRADVWQLLADILASGAQISPTLEAMAEAYHAQGRPTVAAVLIDLREAIPRGRFVERVAGYTGSGEQIILQGYGEVDAGRVFASAARLLRMQLTLSAAIRNAVALPALLVAGLIGMVFLFGLQLYPSLEQIVDFAGLPIHHQWVIAIVSGFTANPWVPVLVIAALATALAWALPNWSGTGRRAADRIPPFSLMRLSAGAGFLFGVIEHGRSGQAVTTRLFERMAAMARPYASSRISAIARVYVRSGGNLGTASIMAGQGFPAPELGAILRMLWNEADGIERAGAFTDRWLARIEATLQARMLVLNAILLTLIAGALILLMSVALPVVNQITGQLYQ